jgi:hypothetical protein
METAIGNHGTSKTLKVFIDDKLQNNDEFKNICAEFRKINLEYNFKRSEFPVKRSQNNSTFDLISMHAVNANSLEEFREKCLGLIPISSNQKLFEVLSKAEVIYDKTIWNEYQSTKPSMLKFSINSIYFIIQLGQKTFRFKLQFIQFLVEKE